MRRLSTDTTFRIRYFYVKIYRSISIGNIDYVLLPTTDATFISPVKVVQFISKLVKKEDIMLY
jgi:hypothetical protein